MIGNKKIDKRVDEWEDIIDKFMILGNTFD